MGGDWLCGAEPGAAGAGPGLGGGGGDGDSKAMSLLFWALFAFQDGIGQEVARYATAQECEIGRVQWEMQHAVVTACVKVHA